MAIRKTYQGWAAEGRAVKQGEKAAFYLRSPDGTQTRAVFLEEQTEPVELIDGIWTDLISAGEREIAKATKKTRAKGGCKLKARKSGSTAQVWAGPNKDAIKVLQTAGFRFDRHTRRWVATREGDKFDEMIAGLEYKGFEVVDEREVV